MNERDGKRERGKCCRQSNFQFDSMLDLLLFEHFSIFDRQPNWVNIWKFRIPKHTEIHISFNFQYVLCNSWYYRVSSAYSWPPDLEIQTTTPTKKKCHCTIARNFRQNGIDVLSAKPRWSIQIGSAINIRIVHAFAATEIAFLQSSQSNQRPNKIANNRTFANGCGRQNLEFGYIFKLNIDRNPHSNTITNLWKL